MVIGVNRTVLMVYRDGQWQRSHFGLWEFQNPSGLVIVHHSLLLGLELLRGDLNDEPNIARESRGDIEVFITNATRTDEDIVRLVRKYGWADKGGRVSRDTQHHWSKGGVAADIVARYAFTKGPISTGLVVEKAKERFDFVKIYKDHVHVDQRDGGTQL
jgi:hypothetical protein